MAADPASFLILRIQVPCGFLMRKPNLQLPAQPCKTHFASTKTKTATIIIVRTTYYYVLCKISSFQSCPWMSVTCNQENKGMPTSSEWGPPLSQKGGDAEAGGDVLPFLGSLRLKLIALQIPDAGGTKARAAGLSGQ